MTFRRSISLPLAIATLLMTCSCGWVEDDLSDCAEKGIAKIELRITDAQLALVWDTDSTAWHSKWHYGWDSKDTEIWGPIGYNKPESYEVEYLNMGSDLTNPHLQNTEQETEYSTTFLHSLLRGYNNLLAWSNVNTSQGVQSLVINDDEPTNVVATSATVGKNKAGELVCYPPDIFYQGTRSDILITGEKADYDYYDATLKEWVKLVDVNLTPLVDIYLSQVIIYNNNSRIYGINGDAVITNFSRSVCVNDRIPSDQPTAIAFPMRMKRDIYIDSADKNADIIGGKLTTFGLCPVQNQLRNRMSINVTFSNQRDSTFTFDLTPQVQAQPHGGILTVELDMDTIRSPAGSSGGSTFDPWVKEYADSITHYFDI